MHRMNYENRLMNASASNHFPDKYAHTYSFSPPALTPTSHPTPIIPFRHKIYDIFLADLYRNDALLRHHGAKNKNHQIKGKLLFLVLVYSAHP